MSVFIRDRIVADTHVKSHVKMEAETGISLPQAEKHHELLEAGTTWKDLLQSLQRECGPADTLTLDYWPHKNMIKYITLILITLF